MSAATVTSVAEARALAVRTMWTRRVIRLLAAGAAAGVLIGIGPIRDYIDGRSYAFAWALTAALVGLSVNVLAGYAGQISLAQAVLYGSGAFTIGHMSSGLGIPWLISLPIAGLLTAAIALIIGFPALRVRGLNLAILTLGFQIFMQRGLFRLDAIGGGAAGIEVRRPTLFGWDTQSNTAFLWVILAVIAIVWIVDRNLTRSKTGRAFFALRQDEQVAASFGIAVSRYKLLAFAISGFYAGLAGGLFGTLLEHVSSEPFEYNFSIEFLVFAVLGGLGSRLGTAFGAAFSVMFRSVLGFLGFSGVFLGAVLLVGTIIRYPGGIAEQTREFAHIGKLLAGRGFKYFLGFLGVSIGSIALGIAFPFALTWAIESATPVNITTLPAVISGIAVAAISSQIGLRYLVARSGHALSHGAAGQPVEAPTPQTSLDDRLSLARSVTFRRPGTSSSYRGPLLSVDDVAIAFGGVRALDGVSLEVRSGELIGIMGPNGSGKTTLLNNISGFLNPDRGTITFRGKRINEMPPHARAALGLGRTFQHVGLVKNESVRDNFLISQHLVCAYGVLEGLVRTGAVISEERRLAHRAAAAIELLGLEDIVNEPIAALPHGRAKLVELGCALVTGPELLLLDEPAAGVSPQEADALGDTLKAISAHFGVTILMIEHHVPLMLSTCDYIYVLNFGQMLTHGEPMEVARHPDVIAAYLGTTGKEASSLVVAGGH